jgi:hypothetical protein
MPSSSPEKAKDKSATIRIHNENPDPSGLVLVAAGGRVHFKNEDDKEYQVSIGRERPNQHVEFVLPEHGSVTIVARPDAELYYTVFDKTDRAANGHGGGPIKSEADMGAVKAGAVK